MSLVAHLDRLEWVECGHRAGHLLLYYQTATFCFTTRQPLLLYYQTGDHYQMKALGLHHDDEHRDGKH